MAGSVDKVNELTLMLREKALPAARSELETLTAFAKSKGFTDEKARSPSITPPPPEEKRIRIRLG